MKQKKKIILVIILVAFIVFAVIFDNVSRKKEYELTDFAMGAVITQKITGRNAEGTADEIIEKIKDTEKKISWRIENSEIANLNKNKKAQLSEETEKLILDTLDVCKKSGGQVDLTVGELTRLWNIGGENFAVPQEREIKNSLQSIAWQNVKIENGTAVIGENQLIDLGFVGKGIACDKAKEILEKNKATQGIINVGGSLCLYGDETFKVGLRNPLGDVNDYMAVLTLNESFVSTSGNYERYSEFDGKKYHHILSTDTGYPVDNDLLSVTIICSSGLLSDALSTACYCLGYEESLELLETYNAEAVFIFNDNTVKITDGLKDKIEIKNDEFKLWKEN